MVTINVDSLYQLVKGELISDNRDACKNKLIFSVNI